MCEGCVASVSGEAINGLDSTVAATLGTSCEQ